MQPEEQSPEAMVGRRPTKAETEGRGSPVELVDRQVTVEARELGTEVDPQGPKWTRRVSEAEGGGERYSDHGNAGGWQSHGARTV